ncbi:GDSL esterase/lipase At5g45910 [Cajanus cajan]|uniref:GDSL esterase/lipase At5g45910 family n=1 Tax=Cajanus cajan TaxID=3821 RepID=A0A151QTU5_CAJCA|nr:GDSL esterase/lipase At5g45910 [Cajanus cajan]KYP33700.1 GDSL esterase/lipase At5g45910 family [Cajanus cajan]
MKICILFSLTFAYGFLGNGFSNANPLPYDAIFNFGDSISDTGNAATYNPTMPSNSPYGSTYFNHPSGRMSNGRLIIDFIAEAYGLPMLPPYLNLTKGQDITQGVNFAYAGSTALDKDFFMQQMLELDAASYSLSTQLEWFKKLKPSLCKSEECDSYFKNTLFIVGEIGGNDINAIIPYKNMSALREMVPLIVEAITNVITKLIEEGAVELVVPGNFPIGCNSAVLARVGSDKKEDYDQFGCLAAYNAFIEYYNRQLKKAIETLRQKNPHVKITYFDYYGAAKCLFQAPQQYGFSSGKIETFRACCGKGEPYGLSEQIYCGSVASMVCSDPSKRINWDGPHFTEAAYRLIAKGIVEGPFANPSLKSPPFKIA